MSAPLYDAHIHLADPVFDNHRAQIETCYETIQLKQAVVVGTCPADWPQVLELCNNDARLIPAVGLHPWQVNDAPSDWQQSFLQALAKGAQVIGEIGLDKWTEGHDIERQQAAFRWQLAHATEHNLPVSIHCLKAIGPLMDTLRSVELPARGFHLHAYNGPVELIPELVELGCHFSFNAGQSKSGKSKATERIRAVPSDRLLIETDAPDMLPPEAYRSYTLSEPTTGQPLTHPATLIDGYNWIADIRGLDYQTLTTQVCANFTRYFYSDVH